jgi:hypothetical protein
MSFPLQRGLVALLVPAALAAAASSCNLVAGLDFKLGGGGGGGGGEGGAAICNTAAQCDDREPCTVDTCGADHVCAHAPRADGPAPDAAQTAGDCRTVACVSGHSTVQPDDSDVLDDKKSCTLDTCQQGTPTHVPRPAQTPCDDGFGGTGHCDLQGSCLASDCLIAGDCQTTNPCVTPACDTAAGTCVFPALPDGTPTPGVAQLAGDCHVRICVGGLDVDQIDDSDVPLTATDCDTEMCGQGVAANPILPAHSPCSTFLGSQPGYCDDVGTCRQCAADVDCPGPSDDCQHPACVGFACVMAYTPMMTLTSTNPPQIAGDCHKLACDGGGGVLDVIDPTDPHSDGNPCTVDGCSPAGVPTHAALPNGTACGAAQACLAGMCSGCTTSAQCTAPNTCGGAGMPNVCGCTPKSCAQLGKTCGTVPDGCFGTLTCNDAVQDGTETDVDCGGATSCGVKCAAGKKCAVATDCASGFCADGVCCNASCGVACRACNLAGLVGTCSSIPAGQPDNNPACTGTFACNGAAACKLVAGQPCVAGTDCVSGLCGGVGVCQ